MSKITSLNGFLETYGEMPSLNYAVEKFTRPTEENFWQWREIYRLYTGAHKKPDFNLKEEIDSVHNVHLNTEDPVLVSYYADVDKAKRDIVTTTKVGRYLAAFYNDLWSAEEIRDMATLHRATYSPPELHFTPSDTSEETQNLIEEIFDNGPNSCMKRGRGYVNDEQMHPVRAYASPDLAIAYIKKADTITARCVVNINDKTFVKMYGDEIVLRKMLEELGYRRRSSALKNCRLLAIQYAHRGRDHYLMPYVDGTATYADFDPEDETFLRITDESGNGNVNIQTTAGTVRLMPPGTFSCECCGTHTQAEDAVTARHGIQICPTCADEEYTYATDEDNNQTLAHRNSIIYAGFRRFADSNSAYANNYRYDETRRIWQPTAHITEHVNRTESTILHNLRAWPENFDITSDYLNDDRVIVRTHNVRSINIYNASRLTKYYINPFVSQEQGRYMVAPSAISRTDNIRDTAITIAQGIPQYLSNTSLESIAQALRDFTGQEWSISNDPFIYIVQGILEGLTDNELQEYFESSPQLSDTQTDNTIAA